MATLDTFLSRVKTALEIVAIPVAAYWAFTRFLSGEAPALEYRTDVSGELRWHARTAYGCIGEYTGTFQNIGKTSLDVTGGRVRVWQLTARAPEVGIAHLDPRNIREGTPIAEHDVTSDVKGHYAPDVRSRVNVAFRMKRNPGQVVLFAMEGEAVDTRGHKQTWSSYRLGQVCGENQPSSPTSTAS